MSKFINEARQLAAQCWCDETTSGKEMDVALAEVIAWKIAAWMDTAASMQAKLDALEAKNARLKDSLKKVHDHPNCRYEVEAQLGGFIFDALKGE